MLIFLLCGNFYINILRVKFVAILLLILFAFTSCYDIMFVSTFVTINAYLLAKFLTEFC